MGKIWKYSIITKTIKYLVKQIQLKTHQDKTLHTLKELQQTSPKRDTYIHTSPNNETKTTYGYSEAVIDTAERLDEKQPEGECAWKHEDFQVACKFIRQKMHIT